jgi:uncharacterized protein YkwD
MKLAQAQAAAMASRDKLDHNVIRAFNDRLKVQGYRARAAAENIGAGYHSMAEAFSGWRNSYGHRANLLLNGATHMGIASAHAPNSKYKVYWTLILAKPDEGRKKGKSLRRGRGDDRADSGPSLINWLGFGSPRQSAR